MNPNEIIDDLINFYSDPKLSKTTYYPEEIKLHIREMGCDSASIIILFKKSLFFLYRDEIVNILNEYKTNSIKYNFDHPRFKILVNEFELLSHLVMYAPLHESEIVKKHELEKLIEMKLVCECIFKSFKHYYAVTPLGLIVFENN